MTSFNTPSEGPKDCDPMGSSGCVWFGWQRRFGRDAGDAPWSPEGDPLGGSGCAGDGRSPPSAPDPLGRDATTSYPLPRRSGGRDHQPPQCLSAVWIWIQLTAKQSFCTPPARAEGPSMSSDRAPRLGLCPHEVGALVTSGEFILDTQC